MVLATWWYEDGQSGAALPPGMSVDSPSDDDMGSLTGLPHEEVCRRIADGHRPYLARVDGVPAAYGWVATRTCSIGELNLSFDLPTGNRYLWDFGTAPAFRGRGVYPHLLGEVLRRECPPAVRFWIIHAPENVPSGIGIARAGFKPVAELSFDENGRAALSDIADPHRASAAAELLGLPLVSTGLDACWVCGGSCRDHAAGDGGCSCAIVPGHAASQADQAVPIADRQADEPPAVSPDDSPRNVRRSARRAKHRIGPVVAASLVAGLVAALVAVVGPFGGARENIVAGAALLGFSLGWALLATISVRFTDQPQRWATVPAVLTASTGGLLMAWEGAVTHDWFGWVWPPLALALAGWVAFESRGHMSSRVGLGLLYGVSGLVAIAAMAGAVETVHEAIDRRAQTMPGKLVSVGDHRLHISCTGAGSPTVVLEPGLGELSSEMSAWIAPAVAAHTRVCVYDRAGRGWSESSGSAQDGLGVAKDLHALLKNAGEPGPYVLAGHSLGGAYVMSFAHLYPSEVAGVVLIDSMHPEQYDRVTTYSTFYQTFRRVSGVLPSLTRVGLGRLIRSITAGDLPEEAENDERAFWSTARQYRSLRDEFAELPTALEQAGQLKTLAGRPLIVLTAGSGAEDEWPQLQDELASLSTNTLHRIAPNATHLALVEDEHEAAASSQAIIDVVSAVRTGQALSVERP